MRLENIFRTKPIENGVNTKLRRCLTAFDLIMLGIGAIIGAGIFVLTGVVAATKAGPAITLSYILAGFACACAALAYAELASTIGGTGSAYSYGYVAFGELIAWLIGWDLLLEYGVSVCTVAIGWSGYMNNMLNSLGIFLPPSLVKAPAEGGIINVLAIFIIIFLSTLLALGIKLSVRINAVIVLCKLAAIGIFIAVASKHFNINNWDPFMPFGWLGVAQGAALVFFAYIGFDAVSTAAEETIHPQRDLSIGIISSFLICTIAYIVVAGLLTGIAYYPTLNVKSPVAETILNLGHTVAASAIALGAIAGLTSVILIFIFGLTRIFYAIAKDGLLPSYFSKINPMTQTPLRIIIVCTIIMSLIAGFSSMKEVAELVNIGTLAAFIIVCVGVIYLRYKKPELKRPFKTPFSPFIPLVGIILCAYLMFSLPLVTWLRFIVWWLVGVVIYFLYSYHHSVLTRKSDDNNINILSTENEVKTKIDIS